MLVTSRYRRKVVVRWPKDMAYGMSMECKKQVLFASLDLQPCLVCDNYCTIYRISRLQLQYIATLRLFCSETLRDGALICCKFSASNLAVPFRRAKKAFYFVGGLSL